VGFAANGAVALVQEARLQPEVITMDIEMPEMDGLAAVRALRARGSKAAIIMCSTLTSRGASSAIEALMCGANDYVTKPSGSDSTDGMLDTLRLELIPKIKQFFLRPQSPIPPSVRPALVKPKPVLPVSSASFTPEQRSIVVIGVSTGGPTALLDLLPRLPKTFPLPIAIVQHMPPIFTQQLAERLSAKSAIEVLEGREGMPLLPGRAVLAPGDFHMRLKKTASAVTVTLDQGERENSCRPAVDTLFRSVQQIYGGRSVGVILTGMGQDGLRGVADLRKDGAYIIAQDRASSVVWGMPGAVVEAGLADAVLSLNEVAPAILRLVPKS
jgi:two-component system chemotaxis response regulator CheB